MALLTIFVLIVAFAGLLGLRQMIRAKATSEKFAGGVLAAMLLVGSAFLVVLLDALSAANDRARLVLCAKNMKLVFQATLQYKQDYGLFPSNLAAMASSDTVFRCFPERSGPDIPYSYKEPEPDADPEQCFCWCAQPHHIRHKYLRFRSRKLRNSLYPDGTVRQETSD